MATVRGLHVRAITAGASRVGTTPVDARRDLAGLIANPNAAFGPRPGVLSGCAVSGSATAWNYSVAAGHLVTSRSAADGAMLWAIDGPTLVATSPAPGSGSRVDIVYAMHNDPDAGSADNDSVLGVAQGVAIPSGAIELGRATLSAGASNTTGATFSAATTQYTAMRGAAIPVTGQSQRDALSGFASLANPITVRRIDTGRTQRNLGAGWYDVDGGVWADYTPVLTAATTNPTLGSGSSATGRWVRQGGLVTGWFYLAFGSSGVNAGSGDYRVSLPYPASNSTSDSTLGAAWFRGPAGSYDAGIVSGLSSTTAVLRPTDNTAVNSSNPWTWVAGTSMRGQFTYEVAT